MKYLTVDQHREVVERLVKLSKRAEGVRQHAAGFEYTSLMLCFLLHSKSAAESILRLARAFDDGWFPVTVGYIIVRSLFEVDVTAHYITNAPAERSRRYINFGDVINKQMLDAVDRNRKSSKPSWSEGLGEEYTRYWLPRAPAINDAFARVRPIFGKDRSWSGKTIQKMATEVDHIEAYEIFYKDLSSFTHVNVKAVDRFLRLGPNGPLWSQRSSEFDVGSVFRYGAIFLSCLLETFGEQFGCWSAEDVAGCWEFET